MITRASRNPAGIILQKYVGTISELPFRESIPVCMLQNPSTISIFLVIRAHLEGAAWQLSWLAPLGPRLRVCQAEQAFLTGVLGFKKAPSFVHVTIVGHTPSTAGRFWKKFRKNSGKTPETLSERFLEFPSGVRLGSPKPYKSRHLKAPEHFQNCLPPSTAGDASFFRSGSREGLSEPVMEFPAVLGVFLICARNHWLIEKSPVWGSPPITLS